MTTITPQIISTSLLISDNKTILIIKKIYIYDNHSYQLIRMHRKTVKNRSPIL